MLRARGTTTAFTTWRQGAQQTSGRRWALRCAMLAGEGLLGVGSELGRAHAPNGNVPHSAHPVQTSRYQSCGGDDAKKRLLPMSLLPTIIWFASQGGATSMHYLNQSSVTELSMMPDGQMYEELSTALSTCGVTAEQQKQLMSVLAGEELPESTAPERAGSCLRPCTVHIASVHALLTLPSSMHCSHCFRPCIAHIALRWDPHTRYDSRRRYSARWQCSIFWR